MRLVYASGTAYEDLHGTQMLGHVAVDNGDDLAPLHPKGERGRPPIGLERMLRIHFLQQWYALADPALEEALYDSQAMRGFAGIDLAVDAVPDAVVGDEESSAVGWFDVEDLPELDDRQLRRIAVALSDQEQCVFD